MKFRPAVVEDDAPATQKATSDLNETLRLSLPATGRKTRVSYAPDAAPQRFELAEEEEALVLPPLPQAAPQKEWGLSWLYQALTLVAIGWIALTAVAPDMPLLTFIQSRLDTLLPGLVVLLGVGALWLIDAQGRRATPSNHEVYNLGGKMDEAQSLAKAMSDVQLQMRGVNTQFWMLQKNISDFSRLKGDLDKMNEDVTSFATLSRQTLIDWQAQLADTGNRLEDAERITARMTRDSLESCAFLSDRIEELNENIEGLTDLQDKAADNARDFTGLVRTAREDMKDIVADAQTQQEDAIRAQEALRDHMTGLTAELSEVTAIAKSFDGVRAEMGLAANVLSRGVRESLVDVKVLLQDWKETKAQLENVLGTATDRVTREFDAQLGGAKQFLAEWDYQIQSRLDVLKTVQLEIQDQMDAVPQALQKAAKSVIAETPGLVDQLNSFRQTAAIVHDAQSPVEAPDLKPLMKTLAVGMEDAFQKSMDVLVALRPNDAALKHRDDLPALTIRLRQVLESVKPDMLAASIKSKSSLREGCERFVRRFGAICEDARQTGAQGEWVAAALASSEMGRIHRILVRALEQA